LSHFVPAASASTISPPRQTAQCSFCILPYLLLFTNDARRILAFFCEYGIIYKDVSLV